ncbi:hypothetical protein I302_102786 [Kwoniella bestiolae CBS 10118]|uniref:Zn(2)-C6 fungal-type domain-containing protein n=1 Tax=Kwoniella bestiolae CBS 10118 TaxID=1296100 RepID=A0A1B9GG21_9TREE|nr:hypothetical protein I302_01480 [Kwoniella bestiolae CBS 10118]OCF29966.1 hypothetical protein I302_01480 [Kwoniella bestiolae CBS 10118]
MSNQNQNTYKLPPWLNHNDQAPPGWIPTWNSTPMNSSASANTAGPGDHPANRPQDNPHWQPGQIETPIPTPATSHSGPSKLPQSPTRNPSQRQQQERHEQLHQPQYYDQAFARPFASSSSSFNERNLPPLQTSTPSSSKASNRTSPKTSTNQPTPVKTDAGESGKAQTGQEGKGGKKRKRKSQAVVEGGDDQQSLPSLSEGDKDKEKRTKTGRACDACRTKKIRCDILPAGDLPSGLDTQPICAHCKQNNLECTFFLPITETRFKKKRQATKDSQDPAHPHSGPVVVNVSSQQNRGSPDTYDYENEGGGAANTDEKGGGRVEGPTSIAFLLHTTIPTIPSEAFDMRHHNSWEVLEDGNGVIRVNAPPTAPAHADADPTDPTRAHNRLNKPILSGQTMSLLVNAYFDEVAPLFPIISRAEFAAKTTPSPLMLYSICGLGATRRQFPREIFAGVRGVINGLLRSNDILSDARFENVQALLLLAQVGDLHAQPTAATASASLIRTGAAIRMAQDLGLHRESSLRAQGPQDLAYVELRRRVWATCVIMDRWYGAALGIPLLVDLLDCDVLLPAPYAISILTESSEWPLEPSFMALSEHLKLSILIGRVLKIIYSPTGLKHTTDPQLAGLVGDMEEWKIHLPEQLQFRGKESSHVAGLLHLGYTALQFLFWRVFMRITYSCPPHLTFCVEVSHWSKMIKWSRDALEWLDANDDALDSLFIFPYAATSCALIQYHTWARRGDSDALDTLKLVKETATRWEQTVQPDQMSIRRKTCETMTLLYEAALKTDPDSLENRIAPRQPANPTAGVIPRQGVFSKVQFKKDENVKGGGFFVAESEDERQLTGLNQKDVMLASEMSDEQNQDLRDQTHNRVRLKDKQVDEAAIIEDQQAAQSREQPKQHQGEGGYEGPGSALEVLQSMPKGSYNVNPLIAQDGTYSNESMNFNQSEDSMNMMAGGMMDITRQAQHYPMPNYPMQPQELQQYQQSHQNHFPPQHGSGGNQTQSQNQNHLYGPPQQAQSHNFPHHLQPGRDDTPGQNQSSNNFESHYATFPPGYSGPSSGPSGSGGTGGPGGNLDPSFLDSLPVSTFDWESWTNYFDKFLPSANQNFETMQ